MRAGIELVSRRLRHTDNLQVRCQLLATTECAWPMCARSQQKGRAHLLIAALEKRASELELAEHDCS